MGGVEEVLNVLVGVVALLVEYVVLLVEDVGPPVEVMLLVDEVVTEVLVGEVVVLLDLGDVEDLSIAVVVVKV